MQLGGISNIMHSLKTQRELARLYKYVYVDKIYYLLNNYDKSMFLTEIWPFWELRKTHHCDMSVPTQVCRVNHLLQNKYRLNTDYFKHCLIFYFERVNAFSCLLNK